MSSGFGRREKDTKLFQYCSGVSDRLEKRGEQQRKSQTDKDKVNLKGAEVKSNMASPGTDPNLLN